MTTVMALTLLAVKIRNQQQQQHQLNGPLCGTTRVSRSYQKGKTGMADVSDIISSLLFIVLLYS